MAYPFNELASNSMAADEAFAETHQQQHPEGEMKYIDLFEAYAPVTDEDVLTGWEKIGSGETLTDDEQTRVSELSNILGRFLSAGKYALVAPMRNLSFPLVVKAYIDAISIASKIFKYSAGGPWSLSTDKKVLRIQSHGGYYTEGPVADFEIGDHYLRAIMTFPGVPSYGTIITEGHNTEPHRTEEIETTSINNAEKSTTTS